MEDKDRKMRIVEMMFIVSGFIIAINPSELLVTGFFGFLIVTIIYFLILSFNQRSLLYGRFFMAFLMSMIFVLLLRTFAEEKTALNISDPGWVGVFIGIIILLLLALELPNKKSRRKPRFR